jgi:hypothetical protein
VQNPATWHRRRVPWSPSGRKTTTGWSWLWRAGPPSRPPPARPGLSERTAFTRPRDPAFQKRIKEVRSDIVRRSAGLLSAAAGRAVRTLLELTRPPTPPTVRLGASKAVTEIGLKVRKLAELEVEVRALEERLDALGPPTGQ